MSEVILTPTTVNDIEFYVSVDGLKVGLSISGLARLCGMARQTVSDLVNSLGDDAGNSTLKSLEALQGKVFIPAVSGLNSAKIIDHKAASRIIRYYAYESKYANDTAKVAYDKFAEIGLEKWVKQLTGFSESNNLMELTGLIHTLIEKVDKLEVTTQKYNNIKTTTVSLYPGIDYINTEIEDGYLLEEVKNDEPFTATEWLAKKGLILDKSTKHKFALLLSQTYASITQKEPRKILRKDNKGNLTQRLNGFVETEAPILEIALKKLLNQF